MKSKVETLETTLPKGRTLRIQDGKGIDLTVTAGCLWVTYEHDSVDIVLETGDSLQVGRDGLTLVHACKAAQVQFAYPAGAGAPQLTLGRGYREIASSVTWAIVAERLRAIRGWISAGARAMRPGRLGMTSR